MRFNPALSWPQAGATNQASKMSNAAGGKRFLFISFCLSQAEYFCQPFALTNPAAKC
jgi:hypothetical protein